MRALFLAAALFLSRGAAGQQSAVKTLTIAVTAPAGAHSVTLNWTASAGCLDANGNPLACPSAVWYDIFRSTAKGTGYTQVAQNLSGTTWTDKNVTAGVTYYYVANANLPACPATIAADTPPCGNSVYSNEAAAVIPTAGAKRKWWKLWIR